MTFWLNGVFHDEERAVSVADRGFLLGDGLFETILLVDGAPVFLKQHLARMRASAAALAFDVAYEDAELRQAISNLARKNGLKKGQAVARITLTRGPGGRGLDLPAPESVRPTLLIAASAYRPPPDEPVRLIVSKYRRAEGSVCAVHKTLAYLDSIMARAEAKDAGAGDAVMLNSSGRAACAAAANIFSIVDNGVIRTPPVSEGALPGVARRILLDEAQKAGIAVEEAPIEAALLDKAPLFLTNSLIGVRPAVMTGAKAAGANAKAADILQILQSCYGDAVGRELGDR